MRLDEAAVIGQRREVNCSRRVVTANESRPARHIVQQVKSATDKRSLYVWIGTGSGVVGDDRIGNVDRAAKFANSPTRITSVERNCRVRDRGVPTQIESSAGGGGGVATDSHVCQ